MLRSRFFLALFYAALYFEATGTADVVPPFVSTISLTGKKQTSLSLSGNSSAAVSLTGRKQTGISLQGERA